MAGTAELIAHIAELENGTGLLKAHVAELEVGVGLLKAYIRELEVRLGIWERSEAIRDNSMIHPQLQEQLSRFEAARKAVGK